MVRWRGVVLGAVTFTAAHVVLVAGWQSWFEPGGAHAAWFLNSGRGVAFTIACLILGSALVAVFARDRTFGERLATGAAFALGAFVAMACVLFTGSPGTIFPIVLVFGGIIALASALAGAVAGGAVRGALSGR